MTATEGYSPLYSSEDDIIHPPSRDAPASHLRRAVRYAVIAMSLLCMLALGYFLGSREPNTTETSRIVPLGIVRKYMHFNGTFPQRANENSDAAWASLFPEKLGFVQNPELAPNVAGIAVFHELHCLDMLRKAFWASVDGSLEEMGAETQEMNHRLSHHHIRHCFEYLRQSLICLADSNLEEMNYTVRGVSGWQTERTCRNFDELSSWADKWGIAREEALRNFDLQGNFGNESLH